jgi:hypothetical protein
VRVKEKKEKKEKKYEERVLEKRRKLSSSE